MTIKNVKLNSKEAELYTYIYSKYSKDLEKYGANRRRRINIDNELVAKLNADPEIQKMFELEEAENVSAE